MRQILGVRIIAVELVVVGLAGTLRDHSTSLNFGEEGITHKDTSIAFHRRKYHS